MARSMTILLSYANACSTASANAAGSATLRMPTDDPRLAGLTNTGVPSGPAIASHLGCGSLACATRKSATGMPAPTSNRFITSLSMPTAAASTPGPANGMPAVFSIPCTDPSSP